MATENLLHKTCEYLEMMSYVSGVENLETRLAKKVLEGNLTDDQTALIEEVFQGRMGSVEKLITPVADKEFTYSYNNPTEYFPQYTPMDNVVIKDGNNHWIYIHSEAQGRYGETYWISVDCSTSLNSLPVIKAFKDYDFQVGHFYRLRMTDEITWGGNKRKYIYEIEECSEEEYMRKGFQSQAFDDGCYDKYYMQEICRDYIHRHKEEFE